VSYHIRPPSIMQEIMDELAAARAAGANSDDDDEEESGDLAEDEEGL
jgi:acyl transferase domain-containing protein